MNMTITVVNNKVSDFEAILTTLKIKDKLTAVDNGTETTYTGDLSEDEAKALNLLVNPNGGKGLLRTVISTAGSIVGAGVKITVNDIAVPVISEATKAIANTGATVVTGGLKVGSALINSTVTAGTSIYTDVTGSEEWNETKTLVGNLWNKAKAMGQKKVETTLRVG